MSEEEARRGRTRACWSSGRSRKVTYPSLFRLAVLFSLLAMVWYAVRELGIDRPTEEEFFLFLFFLSSYLSFVLLRAI